MTSILDALIEEHARNKELTNDLRDLITAIAQEVGAGEEKDGYFYAKVGDILPKIKSMKLRLSLIP